MRHLAILLVLAALLPAQTGYKLPEWVIDEGGRKLTSASSANFIQHGSFHQTTIGKSLPINAANLVAWIGYWHPRFHDPVHDVGVTAILAPPNSMPPGITTPAVQVANFGQVAETFDIYYRILFGTDTVYRDFTTWSLNPAETASVSFAPVTLADTGLYYLVAWTDLRQDEDPTNDRKFDTTLVCERDHDVGVVVIVEPVQRVRAPALTPRVYVHNYGVNAENFWTHFFIFDSVGLLEYHDSSWVAALAPDSNRIVLFANWTAVDGWHTAVCSTALGIDLNPLNDTASVRFLAGMWGWFQTTDVPPGPSGRQVKDGGCLAWVPPKYIYGLKGNKTCEFLRFDIENRSWTFRCTIPRPPWKWRTRPVKKGGAICFDGDDVIYAVKGYNTTEFYSYSVAGDSWVEKDSVPVGPRNRRLKYGSAMAYHAKGESSFVWLLKGSSTAEFLGYWAEGNTWIYHADAPLGPRGKTYKYGSALTTDGRGNVYALKARYNEFYRYDVDADQWDTLAPMPFDMGGHRRKVKDGGALCYAAEDTIFALKGGNTWQFFRYDIPSDSWFEEDAMGSGPSNKRVKGGGALAWCPEQKRAYAFKGNRTYEFWYFIPYPPWARSDLQRQRPVRQGIAGEPNPLPQGAISVPTLARTGMATVRLDPRTYSAAKWTLADITGRVIATRPARPLSAQRGELEVKCSTLPAGVYLLAIEARRHDGETDRTTRKVIISK